MAGKNRTRWEKLGCMLGERGRSHREAMEPSETDIGWNLAGKPQPHDNTQINRNGLN